MALGGSLVTESTCPILSAGYIGATLICTGRAQGNPWVRFFPVVGDDCGENQASILIATRAVRSSTYRGSGSKIFSLHHRNRWTGTMVTYMKQTVVRQLVEADGLVPGLLLQGGVLMSAAQIPIAFTEVLVRFTSPLALRPF